MTWRAITGFRLVTRQPERLVAFYTALGFAVDEPAPIAAEEMSLLALAGTGTRIAMRSGGMRIDLESYASAGRPYPDGVAANAAAFQHCALPTRDLDDAWRRARAAGAVPITRGGPVQLPPASGDVGAVKFRDPEGHPLELIDLRRGSGGGIDHSAIVVRDLDASLAFYRRHGLTTGAATHNVGPAQDRLDDVDGASVDVVPLEPRQRTPHLELLHYRPSGPTIPMPAVNDVAATRIVWHADRAALERDPDGHLHQLEPARAV